MKKMIYKYKCQTNRDDKGLFRQECNLCNCANFSKMILDPGKVLTEKETQLKCPHSNVTLELVDCWEKVEHNTPTIIGIKMDSNSIKKDRMKRSNDHFKKEVYETLPQEDKKLLKHKLK